jgi:L-aspartate semialdehyde sulfurtransferase ferredoxin
MRQEKNSATKSNSPTQQRLWLMYPPKLIKKPFIWEVGHKFKVVTNIRQASVTDEIGIVCLELDGTRDEVEKPPSNGWKRGRERGAGGKGGTTRHHT